MEMDFECHGRLKGDLRGQEEEINGGSTFSPPFVDKAAAGEPVCVVFSKMSLDI